MERIKSLQIFI